MADVTPEDGIAFVVSLCRTLEIPGLARHGLAASNLPLLVTRAREASSMRGNPVTLTDAELTEIAERALSDA